MRNPAFFLLLTRGGSRRIRSRALARVACAALRAIGRPAVLCSIGGES